MQFPRQGQRTPLFAGFVGLFVLALACVESFGTDGEAKEPTSTPITAGPFSVRVPAAWADGVLVQKMPNRPVYSAKAWQERKEDPLMILKPAYANRPEHWVIGFPKLVLPGEKFDVTEASDNPVAPQILIHKTAEWAGIDQDGKFSSAAARKMTRELRAMVDDQDATKTPVFVDAELHFIVEKKKVRFHGGHGFRVLTQWNIETSLVHQGGLHYLFLGLSDDGSCQIVATFPIDIPDLPTGQDSKAEHLGFSMARYGELMKQSSKYERAAKKWLIANSAKATPSIEKLDEMMSSLVVRKWE